MKKISVVLAVVVLVVSLVSLAIAAEMTKGTIKSVDAKAGMVMLTVDGKDMHLTADKSVDLSGLKAGDKVEASLENHMIKSIKAEAAAPKAKPKASVGC
jgi:Cu/Ag efflux protein CusF